MRGLSRNSESSSHEHHFLRRFSTFYPLTQIVPKAIPWELILLVLRGAARSRSPGKPCLRATSFVDKRRGKGEGKQVRVGSFNSLGCVETRGAWGLVGALWLTSGSPKPQGPKIERELFFSQTFRAPPGCPGKIPGCPAKKFGFPGLRGTYRTFRPPPLHMEDPHPTGRYPDQKVWVWVFFLPENSTKPHTSIEIDIILKPGPAVSGSPSLKTGLNHIDLPSTDGYLAYQPEEAGPTSEETCKQRMNFGGLHNPLLPSPWEEMMRVQYFFLYWNFFRFPPLRYRTSISLEKGISRD